MTEKTGLKLTNNFQTIELLVQSNDAKTAAFMQLKVYEIQPDLNWHESIYSNSNTLQSEL